MSDRLARVFLVGKLDGKTAIITGAASGLGRASALLFGTEGANVVAGDLNEQQGRQLTNEITRSGGKALFVKVDVTRPDEVARLVHTAVDTYGGLHVLFNNAGIAGDVGDTANCTLENWGRVIDVNLNAVFYGLKYAIPAMLKSGGGSIINTASILGMVALPDSPAYAASKGAVIQLTKAAALEYAARGIRINCICPGTIRTSMFEEMIAATPGFEEQLPAMVPMGRLGRAEEVARFVLFLASDDASFCTGAPFIMDGGRLAHG